MVRVQGVRDKEVLEQMTWNIEAVVFIRTWLLKYFSYSRRCNAVLKDMNGGRIDGKGSRGQQWWGWMDNIKRRLEMRFG